MPSVEFNNLAGTIVDKQDGNLRPEPGAVGPRIVIVGTAGKGVSDRTFIVGTTSLAKSEFGNDGTLLRGMWEAKSMGADEIALYRIGSTAAELTGVGDSTGSGGYTIMTVTQDESAGSDYSMYYEDATDRLVIRRNSDEQIVYDNDATAPIDLFEVIVSDYRASGGGPDIGSASAFVNLEDVTATGTTFVAGTDGLGLSRMEMYQELYVAYINLLQSDFDVVIPMDIYLDDYNVVDQGHYQSRLMGGIAPVVPGGQTFPTAGAFQPTVDVDSLGQVYVEEYEGEYYFWWWFDDGSGVFSAADITPAGVPGSGSSTTKIDGTVLDATDFHEVNFAYQLGNFLYTFSRNIVDATGVIGVLPPASNSLRDKARWLGKAPVWTLDNATGEYSIASSADNGSGLLGNKFMVGQDDHRAGVFGGGMIATDTGFMDGEEELDSNEIPVDLGKYLTVVADTPLMRNTYYSPGYLASFAAAYGGFYINRAPASAPTNKQVSNTSLIYRQSLGALDSLAGAGYTVLRQKTTGLVVADSPTAARYDSDWNRLSTVRIVKAVIDGVRAAVDPYLGEGISESQRNSMTASIEKVLLGAKKAGFLQDYKPFQIIQTPSMEVAGRAEINLVLVPAFELRQVAVTVSVSKSG